MTFLPLLALTQISIVHQNAPSVETPPAAVVGQELQQDGLPRRGALGLSFTPMPPEKAAGFGLSEGQGLVSQQPAPDLTADKMGVKAGDIILRLNGDPVSAQSIGRVIREIPAGSELTFRIVRNGKQSDLRGKLLEKPRDPGNGNFQVIYSHVVSHGQKMRTIITVPKSAGKHPGFMFIQGFSPISYDYVLEKATGDVQTLDGPILFEFANSDFVTIRVEKPGVGDSEGGPFAELDYITELDIYRQTLLQLKSLPNVDTENVFIFGHSMGGSFGPMIAAEIPVKGLAIYGAAARTWFEYLLDTIRYQGLVGGDSYESADEVTRQGARMMALVMLEDKSPEEVKASHPDLAPLVDSFFPGGMFNGKSLSFWRQLGQINFASYWAKCNARVLAVRGQSDFVTYDADHRLMADIVNRAHPGWGEFAIAPNSDHLFHNFPSEQESMKNFQRGKFNPAFTKMMKDWITRVMASD
ncbi:MAG: PDZ domain-containing protein [Armatimonadetes bacterium]|nr:PDZ domain-containing protein [Armatimonadota bacterium]